MSFQIGFDGVASAELTHLLQGIERQLNWHGARGEAAGETAASSVPCEPGTNCADTTHGGHEPACVSVGMAVVIAVVALVVGLIVGSRLGKRAVSSNPNT
jgi:hypothetical protein